MHCLKCVYICGYMVRLEFKSVGNNPAVPSKDQKETHEQFLRRAVRELDNWLKARETRPKRPTGDLDAPKITSPHEQVPLSVFESVFEKSSGGPVLNET